MPNRVAFKLKYNRFVSRSSRSGLTFVEQSEGREVGSVEMVEKENLVVHDNQVDVFVARFPKDQRKKMMSDKICQRVGDSLLSFPPLTFSK